MTLDFVEGAAGTGKTTTLIARLENKLANSPLADAQRVLALTKMHGGRRRVQARLRGIRGLRGRFECVTIDSFARRLMLRWRALGRALTGKPVAEGFDETCAYAADLLQVGRVQKWLAASFPIVIVDELQDSKGAQLRLLEALTYNCQCLAAGDAFQDLDGEHGCPAVDWARTCGSTTVLTTIHRTSNPTLLAAASALRSGTPVEPGNGLSIVGVPKFELGAWEAASKIAKWRKEGTIAVLSPVSSGRSAFVRNLVNRVGAGPLGKQWPVGPYRIPWESAQQDEERDLVAALGLESASDGVLHADSLAVPTVGRGRLLGEWLHRQRRLHGRVEFSPSELREVITQVIHQARAHRSPHERPLAAMLVHQAKNREFDRVILLWPYEAVGTDERLRRMAYNAVTRARHSVAIIVHGEVRVTQAPFFANPPPPRKPKKKPTKTSPAVRRTRAMKNDDTET